MSRRLAVLASLLVALTARAQRPELVNVLKWKGTISGVGRMTEKDLPVLPPGLTVDHTASFSATVEVERVEADPPRWVGKVIGSTMTADFKEKLIAGDCVVDITAHTAGPFDPPTPGADEVRLEFNGSRGFTLRLDSNGRETTFLKTTKCPNGAIPPETQESEMWVPASAGVLPFPEMGTTLEGKAAVTKDVTSSSQPTGKRTSKWDVTVKLVPAVEEELKLVIDDTEAYRSWRPTTTRDEQPGARLGLVATVESSTKQDPQIAVESFTWELVETSSEPGVAINYPVGAPAGRLDLELGAEGELFELSNQNQKMVRVVRSGFKDIVQVIPFDWGGWSELKVTAVLSNGQTLVGRLRGAAEDNVRLPKRDPDSYIADAWKKAKGVTGKDADDDETVPAGDGTPGDGLSLYEEYRGFYESVGARHGSGVGQHIEAEPKQKDFFILNRAQSMPMSGIARFKSLSKMAVHWQLAEDQLPASRIVNANRAQGPTVGPQHAVVLEVVGGQSGFAEALGGPSSPRDIQRVGIMEDWKNLGADYLASTIAHELFHCVNVWHHGDLDYKALWRVEYTTTPDAGTLIELQLSEDEKTIVSGPRIIRSKHEDGSDHTHEVVRLIEKGGGADYKIEVGEQRGKSSGNDSCVMRYDVAEVAVGVADPSVRFGTGEVAGALLCQSAAGTGVNQSGRMPQSRYGDSATTPGTPPGSAAKNRGNCLSQIHVTDAVPAPKR